MRSRTNVVTYQHTAHQLGPARIVYRFHPFFEHEVRVIRRLRAHEEPAVIVQLEEELRIVVPCWMLDVACCQAMVQEERPRIAVDAVPFHPQTVCASLSRKNSSVSDSGGK